MARKRRTASKGDIAEFSSGRASSSDKREMGFRKVGGRLVPGKTTPRRIAAATKKRVTRKRGRKHN